MKEITGRLEGWIYDADYNVLWGFIYDDTRKRFRDGEYIHTSGIPRGKRIEFKEGMIVDTLNSSYLLGNPSETVPHWENVE